MEQLSRAVFDHLIGAASNKDENQKVPSDPRRLQNDKDLGRAAKIFNWELQKSRRKGNDKIMGDCDISSDITGEIPKSKSGEFSYTKSLSLQT